MYRVRLSVEVQDVIGYQIRDLSKELFTKIVTGEKVYADIKAQERWPKGEVYYTGICRTDTYTWENNLAIDQIDIAYNDWSQEHWA